MNEPRFTSPTLAGPVSRTSSVAAEFAGRVYGWVAAGVLASAFTAYTVQHNPHFLNSAEKYIWLWVLLPFAPLLVLAVAGRRLSATAAVALYLAFTAIEGVSLGVVVSYYTTSTVALAFASTAGLFGSMAVTGTVTKRDLTRLGPLLMCGLLGLIIASFANIFFASTTLMWVMSYLGVAIFLGFTAYDAQRVKQLALAGETSTNAAVMCATALYLDILNLFMFLLQIFGNR